MKQIFIGIIILFFSTQIYAFLESTNLNGKIRRVILSKEDKTVYQSLPVSIGEVVVFSFPSNVSLKSLPVIGDSALVRVEIEQNPLRMRLWGMPLPGMSAEMMVGQSSNMQFSTSSGQSFIFKIVITSRDKSLNRVEISYPAWEKEHLKRETERVLYKKEVEESLKKRFESLTHESENRLKEILSKSFAEFFQCNNYMVRRENNLIFFSSDRICKIGVNGFITVNFRIKNRARKRFHIDTVKIYAIREGSRVEVDFPTLFLQKYSMLFDEVISGGLSFKIMEDEYAERYELELQESAGNQRVLKIPVSF